MPFPEFVEGAAGGGAGVLRILGECYGSAAFSVAEAVVDHFLVSFLRQGVGVAEGYVRLVGGGFRGGHVEDFAHFRGLVVGPF